VHPILSLVLGLICAGVGGELFVRGAIGVAHWARIPAGIVGATVAAFATSSPELAVSVSAALAGTPEIALGDALGSNVVNIGLILGIALLFGTLRGEANVLRNDLRIALAAPLLTGVIILDGNFSRIDAAILFAVFLFWLARTIQAARQARSAAVETLGETRRGRALLECAVGLTFLILAGNLIVEGAKFIGDHLGWSPFVVGATLVAIGTSMPELATTVISRIRGHDEVGLGTVLGSNIFNNLFIVSVAGLITPFALQPQSVRIGLAAGIATLLLVWPNRQGEVPRGRSGLLLVGYGVYVVLLVI